MDGEFQFLAEHFQEGNISGSAMSEGEGASYADRVDMAEIADQVSDESFAGLLAEGMIKLNEEGGVHAQRGDHAQFLGQGIDERGSSLWSDDGGWMPIKRDGRGYRAVLMRIGDGLANDLLMAEVDAVEDADGDADFSRGGGQVSGVMNQAHEARSIPFSAFRMSEFHKRNDSLFQVGAREF